MGNTLKPDSVPAVLLPVPLQNKYGFSRVTVVPQNTASEVAETRGGKCTLGTPRWRRDLNSYRHCPVQVLRS